MLRVGRFAEALTSRIADPGVRNLPRAGAVDQFVDSTAALGDLALTRTATVAERGGQAR